MDKKVLIVDDDNDFNSLLNKVFTKSQYAITSCHDPDKALDLISKEDYDLIVTDHRMPNITGLEFSKLVKEKNSSIPIIMVSGFLDNQTVRELINLGIEGVFLKPVNVFSLMEQTAKILKTESSGKNLKKQNCATNPKENGAIKSYPCLSEPSKTFAQKLKGSVNFRSSLILVGEEGSPFQKIVEDLYSFHGEKEAPYITLKNDQLGHEAIIRLMKEVPMPADNKYTFVFPPLSELTQEERANLGKTLEGRANWLPSGTTLRTIFCLLKTPDALLEDGIIDETLYLQLGTREIKIPPLRDCPADIPALAYRICKEFQTENNSGSQPVFADDAIERLKKHAWSRNFEEFEKVIRNTLLKTNCETISEHDLRFEGSGDARMVHDSLKDKVQEFRNDYIRALNFYFEKDREKVLSVLGCSEEVVNEALRNNS